MRVEFHNFRDKKPDHGSNIYYVHTSNFSWSFEYARVEYSWDNENGGQVCYDPEDVLGPNSLKGEPFYLYVGFDNEYLKLDSQESLFWAYSEDLENSFADELEK